MPNMMMTKNQSMLLWIKLTTLVITTAVFLDIGDWKTHAFSLAIPTLRTSFTQPSSSSVLVLSSASVTDVGVSSSSVAASASSSVSTTKQQLIQLLNRITTEGYEDPILADPFHPEEPIQISSPGPLLAQGGGGGGVGPKKQIRYLLKSKYHTYQGYSNGFWNLLEPSLPVGNTNANNNNDREDTATTSSWYQQALGNVIIPIIPPPIRSALATAGLDMGNNYIPMRDLFTSPAVSFAYERGWRQNFAAAGFPGPDQETQMAMNYLTPAFLLQNNDDDDDDRPKTLVDMSCATGLFTRRFAKTRQFDRVIGCDYSASMLQEARRRIDADQDLASLSSSTTTTRLDLIQCDVGRIPMKSNSIPALHAGAAMHCWPDLPTAVSEIYRVLRPNGGRYFATTFLSKWFLGTVQNVEGGPTGPSRQAFQYFESTDQLRSLLINGGFDPNKISIEVLGRACVVIRCEK